MAEGGRGASNWIYKKSTQNNKITLYVACRDLVLEPDRVESIEGIVVVDPEYADGRSIYGQIIIATRYGKNDEDMIDLLFYREFIMSTIKIWPASESHRIKLTALSLQALIKRLGPNAAPFKMEVSNKGPPSLILMPSTPAEGPTVGITYHIRVFLAEGPDDVVSIRNTLRMDFRVVQSSASIDAAPLLSPTPSSESFRVMPRYQKIKKMITSIFRRRQLKKLEEDDPFDIDTESESVFTENLLIEENIDNEHLKNMDNFQDKDQSVECQKMGQEESENKKARNTLEEIQENDEITVDTEPAAAVARRPAPRLVIQKSFLLSIGKLNLEAWLEKSSYHHGEDVVVHILIKNKSTITVRHIEAKVIQYVDVRMFGNGIFKNVVAITKDDNISVLPGHTLRSVYTMTPRRAPVEDWIAVDRYPDGCLASTVICTHEDAKEHCFYTIYISYYVKILLLMNRFGGALTLKLPFSLSPAPPHNAPAERPYQEEGVGADDIDEGRQCVSADVTVNQLRERPLFEGLTQVQVVKPEKE